MVMSDEDVFRAFVAASSPGLLRTAYLLTHDQDLAEDLLQTALIKTWFAWSRVNDDPRRYVRRVLVTTSVSWWRRRWTREVPTEALPERPASGQSRSAPRGRTCGTLSGAFPCVSAPWWSCATTRT